MPKKIGHILQFHGGVNDASAATDIADNECQIADNCDMTSIGSISLSGDLGLTDAITGQATAGLPGSGLYAFSSDRNAAGSAGATDFYAVNNAAANLVYGGSWVTVNTWGVPSNNDPEFLFHKGILRISDAQLHTTNVRQWWGYYARTHFGSATGADVYSASYYTHNADLTAPGGGVICNGIDYDTGVINFDPNHGSTGGSIPAADYNVGYTFVYDDFQESLIKEFGSSPITIAAGNKLAEPVLYFHTLNSRIAGARIYMKRADTTDDWTLIIDVDLVKGFRLGLNEIFTDTFAGSSNAVALPLTGVDITRLGPTTYRSINGHGFDELIDCSYKTAVVIDGITYAGNVLQGGVKYPDRILTSAISPPFGIMSDVFPAENIVDVATNDGDEIIKLHVYADKVLVFKKRTLYVVNYSASLQGDYIDAVFPFMGIDNKGYSFDTAHGVVFMNTVGVHLYDGNTVRTLTGKMPDMSGRQPEFAYQSDQTSSPIEHLQKWFGGFSGGSNEDSDEGGGFPW